MTGQWWKAWALLTSLGATLLGWIVFTIDEPQVNSPVITQAAPPLVTSVAPSPRVGGVEEAAASARTLPLMPLKPVFQAPVTRTRRS